MSSHIDTNYYVKAGGDIRRPPYIDTIGHGIYTPDTYKVRVFVSALWYRDWASWSEAARIAIDTAIQGVNPVIVARGITIASAAELEPTPSYIFDNTRKNLGVVSILLNAAAISNEREYESVLLVAEARRRVIEKGIVKAGSQYDQYTQYSPAENGTRYIWDDIKDSETLKKCSMSGLFDKADPETERREQLIREFMAIEAKR